MTTLALFDLDGTLIDSEAGITGSIRHALHALGVEPPKPPELREWIGPPLRDSFSAWLGADAARVDQAVHLYLERFDAQGWREHEMYAGIEHELRTLHAQGVKLAVVTSKRADLARRIVEALPTGALFAEVFGPGREAGASSKSELIAAALQSLGGTPVRTTMIGDRRFDIEGARAQGVRSIGVLWGFGSAEELQAAGADRILAQPAALHAALLGH